ncbi:hypothetical protein ATHL_00359 [Anaerolinea thermolimosa]|nr:hypothetical protein ATHL_00359 [Anaerolinea thermolimosa]
MGGLQGGFSHGLMRLLEENDANLSRAIQKHS